MNKTWRCKKKQGAKNNHKNFDTSYPKVKGAIYQDGETEERLGLGERNSEVWIWRCYIWHTYFTILEAETYLSLNELQLLQVVCESLQQAEGMDCWLYILLWPDHMLYYIICCVLYMYSIICWH